MFLLLLTQSPRGLWRTIVWDWSGCGRPGQSLDQQKCCYSSCSRRQGQTSSGRCCRYSAELVETEVTRLYFSRREVRNEIRASSSRLLQVWGSQSSLLTRIFL